MSTKTLCIIGGNGYVGSSVARMAVGYGIKVFCISRRGRPLKPQEWHDKVQWVNGDAMKPQEFVDALKQSDAVVHTIGTLIDSTISQGKQAGEPGSYEHMNRDTAISVGRALNDLNANKKFVYISASGHPPFLPRYLQTKEEAEQFLLEQKNIRSTILKPGFIYSFSERPISVPLKIGVDAWNYGFSCFYTKYVPPNTYLKNFLGNFNIDRSVALNTVAISAIVSAFSKKYDGKKLLNTDMEQLNKQFESDAKLEINE